MESVEKLWLLKFAQALRELGAMNPKLSVDPSG